MIEKVARVDVSTLQERVYQELRQSLHEGRFAAGEVVTIRGLAAALGTSPMPVREALQRLVAEKALVQSPNRSIHVAESTLPMFVELTRTRMLIEGYAAQRAAMTATPSLISRLLEINEIKRQAGESRDTEAVLEANKSFHFEIYNAAEMPHLLEIITTLWLRSGPLLAMTLRTGTEAFEIFSTGTIVHERIIDALNARDVNRARRSLALDIWITARWFRQRHNWTPKED